jgi:outer membrane protein, heavy metal efflux system
VGRRTLLGGVVASVMALAVGCAQYQPKPLTVAAVEKALAAPDQNAVTMSAEALHHPIIQPMPINLAAGLTPQQAGVLAVIINPLLRAERDARAVSSAQLLQAGILPNPTFTAGPLFPLNNSHGNNFLGYNFGLDWDVVALITRDAKVRSAQAQNASVDLDIAWKEWQTAEAAKTAAYDVVALDAALKAAKEADARQAESLDLIRRAYDRNERKVPDLTAAEAAANDAHAAVLTGEHDLQHQVSVLKRSIGLQPGSSIGLKPDIDLPSRLDPPPQDELIDGLETRRLDLLSLKKGYESQDETVRAAILAQFPKLNFGITGGRDTSDVKTIGLGVSLDLPVFDQNQGSIASETATRQKLFDEYTDRVFEARWDITSALEDIKSTNAQIADAEAAIPGLRKFVEVYRSALERGDTDVLSYKAAESELIQKQLAIVKLKQQLIENWILLEIAAGEYLPMPATPASQPTTQEAQQ